MNLHILKAKGSNLPFKFLGYCDLCKILYNQGKCSSKKINIFLQGNNSKTLKLGRLASKLKKSDISLEVQAVTFFRCRRTSLFRI